MATSYKWRYVNIYGGVADKPEKIDGPDDDLAIDYTTLVRTPHLVVIQWQGGPSLHIYIHESLIE